MADLNRIQDDLGFVRRTVKGDAARSHLDPPLRWLGLLIVGGFFIVLSMAAYAWTIPGAAIAVAMTWVGIRESGRRAVAA